MRNKALLKNKEKKKKKKATEMKHSDFSKDDSNTAAKKHRCKSVCHGPR